MCRFFVENDQLIFLNPNKFNLFNEKLDEIIEKANLKNCRVCVRIVQ
jgi:hypothetical protein